MNYIKFLKEATIYMVNLVIAIILTFIIKTLKIKWKSNVWIIGGNGGDYYSDNSAELHRYMVENHPQIELYWVIDKESKDISKAKDYGPILIKHSIKGNLIILLAEVLICNHSIRGDLLRGNMRLFKNSFTVNLGHGISAFKEKGYYPDFSMVIATSDYEKEIKETWMNNNAEKVVVTGFPRFDKLFKEKKINFKEGNILYMPTWRPWLVKKWIDPTQDDFNEFKESDFYKQIKSLFENKDLHTYLIVNNFKLKVYFHRNLHSFMSEFKTNSIITNIEILPSVTDVQQELLKSALLITDYSSVAWDFLYLDRPTLFYQFDYKLYKKYNNSYISMPEELFGPVAYDYQEVIKSISRLTSEEYNKHKHINIKEKFIKFDDAKNCERVIQAILERLY